MGLSREDIFHAWHKKVYNSVLEISKIHHLLPDHVRVLVIGMFKERYPSFKDQVVDLAFSQFEDKFCSTLPLVILKTPKGPNMNKEPQQTGPYLSSIFSSYCHPTKTSLSFTTVGLGLCHLEDHCCGPFLWSF